jgi:inorganic triphosphatase YgiF
MSASASLQAFLTPLLPGWRLQYGRWIDQKKTDRYAVLRPMGGVPAGLVRRPQYSLTLIGASTDLATAPEAAAQAVIAQVQASAGALVFMESAEPVFWATDDGRPVAELAISTILNNT